MKNAIIYTLVFLGLQIVAGAVVTILWSQFSTSADSRSLPLILTSLLFSMATLAVFLPARWAHLSPRYLMSHPWMVVFWSAIAALGCIVPSTWLQEQMPSLPNLVEDEFSMLLDSYAGYLVIGLAAPLVEEVVFRGAVLRSLLAAGGKDGHSLLSPLWAIVLSAVIFSACHFNPAQMPHAFLIGLLLGWMYWRTGSIVPGVVFHWVNNSAAYILYHYFPDPDAKLIDIFSGSEQHVWMALGFSLLIAVPAIFQLHVWMRRP